MHENMKALYEKRNAILEQMAGLVNRAETEQRALSEEELGEYNGCKLEVTALNETIRIAEEQRALEMGAPRAGNTEERALDEKNFVAWLRGDQRALAVADNGGIIPVSVANRIIAEVKEMCPLYSMATVYRVGGDLVIPVYDEKENAVSVAYMDDMAELTESSGKFATVRLENHIAGALVKVSKSLMNRTDFDLASFVIHQVALAMVRWLNRELLLGTEGKMEGVLSATKQVTSGGAAITGDDMIGLQMAVPTAYQSHAVWIMHPDTLAAVRKLKTTAGGEYLFNPDARSGFGMTVLGKPVYLDENMPTVGSGKCPVVYGDMSGLAVKLAQEIDLQVLMEKYATQHAVGVVSYVECDSAIAEQQKIAVLKMA